MPKLHTHQFKTYYTCAFNLHVFIKYLSLFGHDVKPNEKSRKCSDIKRVAGELWTGNKKASTFQLAYQTLCWINSSRPTCQWPGVTLATGYRLILDHYLWEGIYYYFPKRQHIFSGIKKKHIFTKLILPWRLTWNIIMEVGKMIFLSKWVIYRFHVNLPGCSEPVTNHQGPHPWRFVTRQHFLHPKPRGSPGFRTKLQPSKKQGQ